MLCIILTSTQADVVRGEASPGHWLMPVILADGVTYVLPARILDDPYYASQKAFLETLPQREVDPSEFPPPEEEE